MQDSELMVSIRCATYNHAPYIHQCLDGFIMQKTNFRFEVIVHDDASTDGTADIVREYAAKYPDIIKPMFEESNQYSVNQEAMNERINLRLTGKYIAICEGDDYWISPEKLQKQVTYMENHPECTMTCHRAQLLSQKIGKIVGEQYCMNNDGILDPKDIINRTGLYIPTCSLLFKKNLWDNYPHYCQNCNVGDYPLQITAAMKGQVYYFNINMGVYRIENTMSWAGRQKFHSIDPHRLHIVCAQMEMFKGFAADYPQYKKVYEEKIAEHVLKNMPSWRFPRMTSTYLRSFQDEIKSFSFKWRVCLLIHRLPIPRLRTIYRKIFFKEYMQLKMYY